MKIDERFVYECFDDGQWRKFVRDKNKSDEDRPPKQAKKVTRFPKEEHEKRRRKH